MSKIKDLQEENELKELEVIDKTTYTKFLILLYEKTISYDFDEVMCRLKSYRNWAYIKHVPESSEKKEHIHFVLYLEDSTTINSLSKKTTIPAQFIQPISSARRVNRYLTHIDYEDKIHYELSDVVVSDNYARKFNICYDDLYSDEEIMNQIMFHIKDLCSQFRSFATIKLHLASWCYEKGFIKIYKLFYNDFEDYIKENL